VTGIASASCVTEGKARSIWRIDFWLVLIVALLIGVGLMSLFSVSEAMNSAYFQKQLKWLAVGAVPFCIFFFVPPLMWRRGAVCIYILNLLMLVSVLFIGKEVNGARRWVEIGGFQFQPSEMAKLLTILTLAAFFAARQEDVHRFWTFALSFLHILPVLFLIHREPHLGASLVIVVIWLSVALGAGVPLKFVFGSVAATVALLVVVFAVGLIPKYQMDRVLGLLSSDEQGKTYQPVRAEMAFGVGGIEGSGFRRGEVKNGGFIPEQQTDFIFTVIGEEGGLIGCTLVLAGFGFFFFRAWLTMFRATEPFYKMASVGIMGMLAFHTIVNMGMNLQLLPVVGLWLPFMSYGGTALWLCLASVALLLNIKRHERPVLF
jgi:rod shape determining protein RodA